MSMGFRVHVLMGSREIDLFSPKIGTGSEFISPDRRQVQPKPLCLLIVVTRFEKAEGAPGETSGPVILKA